MERRTALKMMVAWWVMYAFLKAVIPATYHQPITGATYLRRQTEAHQSWEGQP